MEDLIFDSYPDEDTTPVEETAPTETDGAPAAESETAETESEPGSDKPAEETNPEKDTAPQDLDTVEFKHRRTTVALDKKSVENIASALGMGANDVTTLLQKGTDYEYKVKQFSDLENKLDRYAKEFNLGPGGVFGMLDGVRDRTLLKNIQLQVKGEHPDWTEDAVNELSMFKLNEQKQKTQEQTHRQEQDSAEAENKPLVDFFMRHPEITVDTMPEEMKTDLMNGVNPEEALLRYQNKQKDGELENLKNEIAKLKKDAENNRKSVGSAVSEVGGQVEDPFIDAFNKAFN